MSENRVFVFVPLEDYLCGISVHSKIDALRFYVFWVHNSSYSLLISNNSRITEFEQRGNIINSNLIDTKNLNTLIIVN